MKPRPKWAGLLLASAGTWLPNQGCHEFHVCGDRPCEPSHGGTPSFAGNSSEGAASGNHDGGSDQGGATACVAPLADCDESTFDGCESNLLVDVRNCGACRAPCVGACIEGKCSPFEVLAEEMLLPAWGGIALTSTEVYAISHYLSNSLVRWSAQQGAQTLFADGPDFQQILTGVDRLYLVGGTSDDGLSSILRSGSAVSAEGVTARAAVITGNVLYAIDAAGLSYWRNEISHETGTLQLAAPLPSDVQVWLAADSDQLALVAEDEGDGADTYTIYHASPVDAVQQRPWQRLTSGVGRPAQVRVGSRAIYIDVVLPHDETKVDDWQIEHELREVTSDGATRVISTLTGLLDFEVVERRFYLSIELPKRAALLRVLSLDDPSRALDVQTSSTMASLTYSEPYFYFGDTSRHRLARLPAWLE